MVLEYIPNSLMNLRNRYLWCISVWRIYTKDTRRHWVLIPGNHDAVRLSDPQPSIPERFYKPLF